MSKSVLTYVNIDLLLVKTKLILFVIVILKYNSMKNLIYGLLFLCVVECGYSQNFQGVAYYFSKTQMGDFNFSSPDMTEAQKKEMKEELSKAFEKTYILDFNNFESTYRQEEKLEKPKPVDGRQIQVSFGGQVGSKLYKNLKNNYFSEEKDLFGKEFLVKDSLETFKWEFINEEKKIGNYTCSKAQLLIPISEKDKKEYEEFKANKNEGKTSFIQMSEPKEQIIEAWYTTEIPISNGPDKYWGLPGLILELHDGTTSLLCSKIILNPEKKVEIKEPTSGKKVNQKQFKEIEDEKIKSMMNNDGIIEIKMN